MTSSVNASAESVTKKCVLIHPAHASGSAHQGRRSIGRYVRPFLATTPASVSFRFSWIHDMSLSRRIIYIQLNLVDEHQRAWRPSDHPSLNQHCARKIRVNPSSPSTTPARPSETAAAAVLALLSLSSDSQQLLQDLRRIEVVDRDPPCRCRLSGCVVVGIFQGEDFRTRGLGVFWAARVKRANRRRCGLKA